MSDSRSKNGLRNILFSFSSSILTVLLSFITRTVFIHFLDNEYLGLNGLFSNVLSFLSLAELGIGFAINYALYQPLKENDTSKLKSLMRLYKRLYTIIGIIVLVLGALLTPFLNYLIKEPPKNVKHLHLYFLLFVFNSGVSYFCTYKRSLIICDQKEYISTISMTISKIVLIVLQLVILFFTHSFLLYTISILVCTIGENLIISYIANKMYPFLTEKEVLPLSDDEKDNIKKNVYALILHKIGGAIVFSSDNIIISKFVGLVSVGLYSNYTLIINSIDNILKKMFSTLTSSVGNLMASNNDEEVIERLFYRMLYANMCLYGISSICILNIMEPFIKIWLGKNFLIPFPALLAASISFYFTGMRKTVMIFKDAAGIFQQDKYKPLIESIVNVAFSIPFAIKFGIAGVLVGTILSTLLVSFWVEGYVLFKHKFKKMFWKYLLVQLKYFIIVAITASVCIYILSFIQGEGILHFIIKVIIVGLVSIISILISSFYTDEFKYFLFFFGNKIKKKR